MSYQQLPMKQVPVKDLALDLDNYRVPIRPDDEAAALNYLFAEEDVLDAATLILRDGYFDNEVPIVVEENGIHVVLEGNRRVSALKALHGPNLVPSHTAEIERLLKRYAVEAARLPVSIRVLVATSREVARPHIARLHTGLPKKRWSRDQQANYYHSLLGPDTTVEDLKRLYPDVTIVRFLKMVPMRKFLTGVRFTDPSLHDYVKSPKLTMSAFEYAYNKLDIAAAIGVTFDRDGRLMPASSTPEAIGAGLNPTQRAAVELLMGRFRANELNTRSVEFKRDNEQRRRLVAELNGTIRVDNRDAAGSITSTSAVRTASDEAREPEAPRNASTPANGSGRSDDATPSTATPGTRGPNHPDTKRFLSLTGLVYETHASRNLQLRYHELRKLDLTEVPAAAAMLLRAVLETTIKFHFEGTPTPVSGELRQVFPQVTSTYGTDKPLRYSISRVQSGNADVSGSVTWFNTVSHNAEMVVDAQGVRDAYSLVEPILRRLLRPPADSGE